jgi:phosphoglycerate dehydrogenase-like enzyme
MGIVGYGDIGRACAQLAKASGMKVVGLRRNPPFFDSNSGDANEDKFVDSVVGPESLLDLCRESDYLVVAVALTPATQRMLCKTHFDAAKPGQVIINVARGGVVAEDDLVEALRSGQLGGAALDVFEVEPLPADSPLWEMENVLISPHNMVTDSKQGIIDVFADNCRRFAAGEELRNVVNTSEGY